MNDINNKRFPYISFSLPDWVESFLPGPDHVYSTTEDRMRLIIELSRLNVKHEAGGPFGAGIFDMKTNRLVAPGINLVIQANCSVVHAEMVAIMIAHRVVGHYDLGSEGMSSCELVTSTEPCAMCFGALFWSGIRRVVCGAREEDARGIGFDEGSKLTDWVQSLESRGISVIQDVFREEASALLRQYYENGGIVYNARQGKPLQNG